MEKEATLLSGDIKKTYVSYLIPTIVGMLTNSVYCIVDVMFVGLCTVSYTHLDVYKRQDGNCAAHKRHLFHQDNV